MKIITKFKDRFSYPIKHQKEKIVIAITLICFLISGFSLPSIRAAYGIEPVEDTITQQDSDSKDANTVQTKKTKKTEKKKEDKEEADCRKRCSRSVLQSTVYEWRDRESFCKSD